MQKIIYIQIPYEVTASKKLLLLVCLIWGSN
jgi:hypothetical protein